MITTESRYMAASGRECRWLQVSTFEGADRPALVCKTPDGWVDQRVLTRRTASSDSTGAMQ